MQPLRAAKSSVLKAQRERSVRKRVAENKVYGLKDTTMNQANNDDITQLQVQLQQLMEQMENLRAENRRLTELQEARETSVDSGNGGSGGNPPAQQQGQEAPTKESLRDAADTLPKYQGDDPAKPVQEWTRAIGHKITAFRWSQLEGYIAATGALEGSARRWADSHPEINSWNELKERIEQEVSSKTSPAQSTERMSTRRCKKEESAVDFFFEMKALGHQVAMQERDVLRYIIKGVTDDEAKQVMLCSSRTYEELCDRLEFMGNATSPVLPHHQLHL